MPSTHSQLPRLIPHSDLFSGLQHSRSNFLQDVSIWMSIKYLRYEMSQMNSWSSPYNLLFLILVNAYSILLIVQAKIFGVTLVPSLSLIRHIQSFSKSCCLYLQNTPRCDRFSPPPQLPLWPHLHCFPGVFLHGPLAWSPCFHSCSLAQKPGSPSWNLTQISLFLCSKPSSAPLSCRVRADILAVACVALCSLVSVTPQLHLLLVLSPLCFFFFL